MVLHKLYKNQNMVHSNQIAVTSVLVKQFLKVNLIHLMGGSHYHVPSKNIAIGNTKKITKEIGPFFVFVTFKISK